MHAIVRQVVALAATALLVASLLGTSQPSPARGAGQAVDQGWVDAAVRFRESIGLRSDRPFVRSTFTDESYSSDDFGVPLSSEEVDLIYERQRRVALAAPGHAWANTRPDFAGTWTDQPRDGLIVYQFTGDVTAETAQLERLLPAEVRFEVRSVERSLARLRALKAKVSRDVEALAARGVEVNGIGLDISHNVVSVEVAGDVDHARDILTARFGAGVDVERGEVAVADDASVDPPDDGTVDAPHARLPDLPLAFGADSGVGWFLTDDAGVGWRDPGSWRVTEARTTPDGRLSFHVSVTPPAQDVPFDAGPAFLSAALWYQGGLGGDVGFGRVEQMLHVDAGTCTGPACTYEADVVLDATAIPRAIEALPHVDPGGVDIGLRLVRTYGQGEWLQVLDLAVPEEPGNRPLHNGGTLRRPIDASGEIISGAIIRASDIEASRGGLEPAFDLRSVIEASRERQGDASAATPTVRVELHIDTRGCRWWNPVWVIDEWGTNGFARAVGEIDPRGELVRLPDGGSWRVSMGSPFPEAEYHSSATAGTFETAGSDLQVEAAFECTEPHAATASAFTVDPTAGVAEPGSVGGWSTVRYAFSARDRGPRPFVLAPRGGELVSLESRPDGWRLRRSDDGWHWRREPFSVRGRAWPEHGSAEHGRLVATDDGLVLATVVAGAGGRPRLATWTSRDARRWRSSPTTPRLPDPVTDLQLAATSDLVLALATGPRRTRLLASEDGRSWDAAGSASVVAVGGGAERILGVVDGAGQAVVSETADGATWLPLRGVPEEATGPYRIAETDAGVLLVSARSDGGTSAWLSEPGDAAWNEVLRTTLPTRIDELAVNGDDVVMVGVVRNAQERGSRAAWMAASHDGGRRWRQSLDDNVSGPCRLRAAAGTGALSVATADCDDQPTLWRTEPGP